LGLLGVSGGDVWDGERGGKTGKRGLAGKLEYWVYSNSNRE
nr:hypothetical protein [Tanacetum cinerariifolium]